MYKTEENYLFNFYIIIFNVQKTKSYLNYLTVYKEVSEGLGGIDKATTEMNCVALIHRAAFRELNTHIHSQS